MDAPISRPDPFNPYRWDEKRKTLLDCDGDVPNWYDGDISIERGGGIKLVEEYNIISRSSGTFISPTKDQLNDFLKSDLEKNNKRDFRKWRGW